MNTLFPIVMLCMITVLIQACSNSEIIEDFGNTQHAHKITYPDHRTVHYCGEVQMITGIEEDQGFQHLINTGEEYCKVRVTYENEDHNDINLTPSANLGKKPMSIINQVNTIETKCHSNNRVFITSFD